MRLPAPGSLGAARLGAAFVTRPTWRAAVHPLDGYAYAGCRLRAALTEALDWIDAGENGHSYCDTQIGGGWAPEPTKCTCGFDDKMDGWRAALATTPDPAGLDVELVVKAIHNVAARHGIKSEPPMDPSLARIYGYSTTPVDMNAQIAAEYDRLRAAGSQEDPA